ncbi:MAG: V-type ATP synthase subunit E [Candidatus Micrarchaeia archaeon]
MSIESVNTEIRRKAEEESEKIIKNANEKAKEIVKEAEAAAKEITEKRINEAKAAASQNENAIIASAEIEARRLFLEAREALIEKELEGMLPSIYKSVKESGSYEKIIREALEQAKAIGIEKPVLYVNKKDIALAKEITKSKAEAKECNIEGGAIVSNTDESIKVIASIESIVSKQIPKIRSMIAASIPEIKE